MEQEQLDLGEVFKKYKEETKDYYNGYFVLFDIINSTSRKDEHKYRWVNQTKLLYDATRELEHFLSNKICCDKKLSLYKRNGDSTFIFLPIDKDIDPEIKSEVSSVILQQVISFLDSFGDKETYTDGLRLKAVICFLNDIYLYKEEKDGKDEVADVIGRGIDFSFRLEKYAKDTHVVLNKMFYESIVGSNGIESFKAVAVQRSVKGWKGLQKFYIVYNQGMLSRMELSHSEDNIYTEILKNKINTEG